MTATQNTDGASEKADGYRLRVAVFDALMAKRHGVTTVEAQADLAGVHRSTMFRWRKGEGAPNYANASKLARLAGTTVDALFEYYEVAA